MTHDSRYVMDDVVTSGTRSMRLLRGGWLWVLLAAVFIVCWSLGALSDLLLINPDTVQLMSAAGNVLSGEGLTSSIIYYDPQYDIGSNPAPLTVWPPAYPLLLAGAAALGLSSGAIAIGIAIASHVLIALLIYFTLRRLMAASFIAAVAALVWLLCTADWLVVLAAYTEPFFMAATLASAWSLLHYVEGRGSNLAWLALAGFTASMAIMTRYAGVLWPFVVGLWFLVEAIRIRRWRPVVDAMAFGALPALTTIGLFVHNFLLTGRISGGQFEFGTPATVLEVIRLMYWELGPVLGAALSSRPGVLLLVLLVCAFAAGAAYLSTGRRGRDDLAPVRDSVIAGRRAMFELAVVYAAVVAGFLLFNAIYVSAAFVHYRYFLPALPFVLIVLALAADHACSRVRVHPRKVSWPHLAAATLCLLAISMVAEFVQNWPPLPRHPATAIIDQALKEKLSQGQTLAASLSAESMDAQPLLAHHEHRVALLVDTPIYGLSDARFTRRVWTTAVVAKLVRERGIAQVLFFPTTYDANAAANANTPFFSELQAGKIPGWLRTHYASDIVVVYDVVDEADSG